MNTPRQFETVADRVRERMKDADQTEKGLAEESGIPRTTLHRRLVDPAGFTISELEAIAPPLGTTLQYLMLGITSDDAVSA